MSSREPTRRMMDYLPSILQEDKFLTDYLSAFEKILIGPKTSGEVESIESVIAGVARQFDPMKADEEFLPWLAQWTAFSLRADLTVAQQQNFLSQIISLYRKRGTAANLQTFLKIFTIATPTIIDGEALEKIKETASEMGDGYQQWASDGGPAHSFVVELSFLDQHQTEQVSSQEIQRNLETARGLIEMEKPAHTRCYLNPIFITMRLPREEDDDREAHSTIEFDTLLGDYPPKSATPKLKSATPPAKGKKK
jgi:phage tail-like protein